MENGNDLSVFGGGFFETNYCSNNFEEIRDEILESVKALFDKDFIYGVAISSRQVQ